jgi:hypothetical protein
MILCNFFDGMVNYILFGGRIFCHLMNPKNPVRLIQRIFHDFCEKNAPKSPDFFEERISEIFIFKQ